MNEQQAQSGQGSTRFSKRKVRWRLFLIGDHGKIIKVPKYEFIAFFLFFVLVVSLLSAAGLFYQSGKNARKNEKLKSALASNELRINELRAENEILAARLVVAGIDPDKLKRKSPEADAGELVSGKHSPNKKKAGESDALANKNDIDDELIGKAFESDEKKIPIATAKVASVGNFQSSYDAANKRWNIQFKLDNISDEKISGYIIVLLKNPEKKMENWRALPDTPLENGKPADYKSGRYFEIRSFKTIRFTAKEITNTDLYIVAEIFIFGKDGSLLAKKEFSMKV